MLDMEEWTAHSPFAQTAKMESAEMTHLACARLDGRATHAARRLATRIVLPMVESATTETACALQDSLAFSVRPRWTFAPTSALATVFAMSGQSSAIARRDFRDLTVPLQGAPRDAMSQMANAMLASATAHQTSLAMTARKRSAPTTVLAMEFATQRSVFATATLGGLDMTVA